MEKLFQQIDVAHLTTAAIEYLPKVGAALLVFLFFMILYRVTRPLISGALQRAGFQPKLIELMVSNIYRYSVIIMGLIMAADQLGINVAAALAGIGVVGIAVGFAAQDSVANVISGILIFWDKPFVVGDWIKTENEFGRVSDITLRTTRIRTPRNTYVVIPNKRIIAAVLENYSKHGELRVDVPIGIAYKEYIPKAREVLLKAIADLPHLKDDPPPDVIVEECGDSSINLKIRVWIDHGDQLQETTYGVMEAAKLALDAAGIQIPYPHLQLFLDNVEDRVWDKLAVLPSAGRPPADS